MVIRLEHLGAPPAQVVDQRFQGSFSLGRAREQLAHFLHAESGMQVADRVRRNGRQQYPNCIWLLRSRPEVALRIAEQAFEDAAEAHERMGDLVGARERHRFIAQLKQLRSEMLLLAEAERQGNWIPSWQQAPSLPAALV